MKIYGMYTLYPGFTLFSIPDDESFVADIAEDFPETIYFELGDIEV